MLKKIITQPYASSLMKIFLKNQMSVVIDYPSYEILTASGDIRESLDIIGKTHDEINHSSAQIAKELRENKLMFRTQGITSSWLCALQLNNSSPIRLYLSDDIPILHNNNLVGILCKFRELTIDNLYLINRYLTANTADNQINSYKLSNSEKEILFLAGLGKSAKQIANLLGAIDVRNINYGTVKSVISQRIYKKINVNNIYDAVMDAIKDRQINNIPETLLKLNSYYLIDSKHDCIQL